MTAIGMATTGSRETDASIRPSIPRRWVYAALGALLVPPMWLGVTIAIQGFFGVSGPTATIVSGTVVLAVTAGLLGYAVGRSTDDLVVTALSDPLTRIGNRRHYEHRIDREIRYALEAEAPLSLMLVDLDFLKRINDSRGHASGDEAVRAVAAAITGSYRCRDFAARIGGDEFAVILPRTRNHEAIALASRIRRALRNLPATGEAHEPLTVSIGIAELHGAEHATAESLFATADGALYDAKMSGRDRACVADPRADGVIPWVPSVSGVLPIGRAASADGDERAANDVHAVAGA